MQNDQAWHTRTAETVRRADLAVGEYHIMLTSDAVQEKMRICFQPGFNVFC